MILRMDIWMMIVKGRDRKVLDALRKLRDSIGSKENTRF